MSERKSRRNLRASLSSVYAGALAPVPRDPVELPPAPLSRGGAPALFVAEQKRSLIDENRVLQAELSQLREDGGADVWLAPESVLDRYPSDRWRLAFEDEDFQRLKASIRTHGQDQPILVRPHPALADRYEIAFGRRRREACRQLDMKVRARVRLLSDEQLLQVMVRENAERSALSLYERGAFVRRLAASEKLTVRRLGDLLGISPAYVSRLMRLPVLSAELEEMIGDPRALSMRVLEELGKLLEEADAVERMVDGWGSVRPGSTPERRARQVIEILSAERQLQARRESAEVREVRAAGGRVIGEARRGRAGRWLVELSAALSDDEVERILQGAAAAFDAAA